LGLDFLRTLLLPAARAMDRRRTVLSVRYLGLSENWRAVIQTTFPICYTSLSEISPAAGRRDCVTV
jgi:hypothetical protein